MTDKTQPSFDQWCIVELFGHQVIAGRVTEQIIGGSSFIRVDIPAIGKEPAFTKFLSQGAIFSMTPVSEEVARLAVNEFRPEPINVYIPELRQLKASTTGDNGDGRSDTEF